MTNDDLAVVSYLISIHRNRGVETKSQDRFDDNLPSRVGTRTNQDGYPK